MGGLRVPVYRREIYKGWKIFSKTVSLFDWVNKSSIPHDFLLLSEGRINLTRQAKLGPGTIDEVCPSSKAKLFSRRVDLINVGGAGQYITGMCGTTLL